MILITFFGTPKTFYTTTLQQAITDVEMDVVMDVLLCNGHMQTACRLGLASKALMRKVDRELHFVGVLRNYLMRFPPDSISNARETIDLYDGEGCMTAAAFLMLDANPCLLYVFDNGADESTCKITIDLERKTFECRIDELFVDAEPDYENNRWNSFAVCKQNLQVAPKVVRLRQQRELTWKIPARAIFQAISCYHRVR